MKRKLFHLTMQDKKPVGRPQKEIKKEQITLRLTPMAIAIIKTKPNQAKFIENLVLKYENSI